MAISFIGSDTDFNGAVDVTSTTLTTPGGTADDDLMIAHIVINNQAATITAPAGWTEIPIAVNETDHEIRWYQHVAAAEPASRAWTFAASAVAASLLVFRGAVNPHGSSVTDGFQLQMHTTNSVSTIGVGAWLLGGWSGEVLLAVGWVPPGMMTERTDIIGGLLVGLNATAMTATEGPVTIGSYIRTATTIDPIDAINSLLAVEAIIDPLLASPFTVQQTFPTATITPGEVFLTGIPLVTRDLFAPGTVEIGFGPHIPVVTSTGFGTGGTVGYEAVNTSPINTFSSFAGDSIVGPPGLLGSQFLIGRDGTSGSGGGDVGGFIEQTMLAVPVVTGFSVGANQSMVYGQLLTLEVKINGFAKFGAVGPMIFNSPTGFSGPCC